VEPGENDAEVETRERSTGRDESRWSLASWTEFIGWPVQILAAATAVRIEREPLWVRRRIERFVFLDGRRLRKSIDIELTVPSNFTTASTPGAAILPVAQPTKRFMRNFRMVDEAGRELASLTRDENSAISTTMLAQHAREVVGGCPIPESVIFDLADVAGLRWHRDDFPDDDARKLRRERALARFRLASTPTGHGRPDGGMGLADVRGRLWADDVMRSRILQRAERFVLFVPDLGEEGDRRKLTIEYEWEVDPREEKRSSPPRPSFAARARSAARQIARGESIDHPVNIPTRGPFSASSYHAEVLAPEDLTVVGARLRLVTTEVNESQDGSSHWEEIASDRSTPLVHLYSNGRRPPKEVRKDSPATEVLQACVVRVRLRVRAGLVLPVVLTASIVAAMLTGGIVAHIVGYHPESATLAAVLLALPALYAAYLLPQGHGLMRRLFMQFRSILVILALLPYAAAATLAIDLGSSFRYDLWIGFDTVALACLLAASTALWRALRVTRNVVSP
jgi:hypothetical protein